MLKNKEIVEKYLDRLGINYEIKELSDITKLIKAHLRTFAFSSLKVLLKEEISLDTNSIYENIVLKKKGGYCFEHNKLMFEVLKELGFDVKYYLARIVNNTENMVPQTHRFTVLDYKNERYLIDVGIGFRSPSVPIKFGKEATLSHQGVEYKIKEFEDNTFAMQLIEKGKPFIVTKFDLNKCYESDFEMGHFYSHKNPKAVFVKNLVSSLIIDDVIYSLVNDKYIKISKDKREEISIINVEQLFEILTKDLNSNFTFEQIEFFYNNYIKN